MLKFIKLIFLSLAILFTVSLKLTAEDLYTLIGIQTSVISDNDKYIPTIGIKYGVQDNNWRTVVGINYGKISNTSYYNMVFDVDKGIFNNLLKNSPIKPYAGLSFSLINKKDTDAKEANKDLGYGYGGKLGLVYIASNILDIDLSYKYMILEKLKNKDNQSLNLSIHYFY